VLIAEDLLLLLTEDATGTLSVTGKAVDLALGGAHLLQLEQLHKVALTIDSDQGRPGRIIVRDPGPVGDPLLDAALETLRGKQGKKPESVINPLSKNLRPAVYERLVASGVLRAERGKVLGLFTRRRWPTADASHEDQVRGSVIQTLVQRTTPDARTAALIALLHALKAEHRIVDVREHSLTRRELRSRAGQIAEPFWAARAVRRAIDAANAAAAGASTAAVTS
jgi:hypothetical protein